MKAKISALFCLLLWQAGTRAQERLHDVPVPNAAQLAWQRAELGVIFHYDLHVFDSSLYQQGRNRVTPVPDHRIFRPRNLDMEQWVLAAKSAGARFALLTATHETGFALYPSDVNPYNVRTLPWREGKADLLREFVDACRKHGLEPGVYIGIRWNSFFGVQDFRVDGEPGSAMQQQRQAYYNKMAEGMVTEICTRYGPLFKIWFDGGAGHPDKGGPDVLPIVKKYQPQALFYHNEQLAEARWGGSESGTVSYPCWSTFPYPFTGSGESAVPGISKNGYALLKEGDVAGKYWVPAMADAPLRGHGGRHEWFWEPGDEKHIYPLEALMDMYYRSVGRNATLLIGLTPDNRGLLPEADVQRLQEWGAEIRRRLGTSVAAVAGKGDLLEIRLPKKSGLQHFVVEEDIRYGHRVLGFVLEARVKGKWVELTRGSAIGNKYIYGSPAPVVTNRVRLRTTASSSEPQVSRFSVFE